MGPRHNAASQVGSSTGTETGIGGICAAEILSGERPPTDWEKVDGWTLRKIASKDVIAFAIVDATGPIRQVVQGENEIQRRYLAIARGTAAKPGPVVQVQVE
jgi:hypothetical protein